MKPTDTVFFCRQCSLGDCYGHVHEFLNRNNKVQVCKCPNPKGNHGRLRPGKRSQLAELTGADTPEPELGDF